MNRREFVKRVNIVLTFILIFYFFKTYHMVESKVLFTKVTSLNTKNNILITNQNFSRNELRLITNTNNEREYVGNLRDDQKLTNLRCFCNRKRSTGRFVANLTIEKMETIEKLLANTVYIGGSYTPSNCTSTHIIAIVIPFRDREEHLNIFLRHMHPYLQRQQLNYRIFVIEMDKNIKFNRGMLRNIGFVEAMKLHNYTCFVFHDIDLLPEDDRISYSCANVPQHLSVSIDKFNYSLPYKDIFGGVFSLRTEQYRKTNGMSNMFFGWGGEDDDLHERVITKDLRIQRPPIAIARYVMMKHKADDKLPER